MKTYKHGEQQIAERIKKHHTRVAMIEEPSMFERIGYTIELVVEITGMAAAISILGYIWYHILFI